MTAPRAFDADAVVIGAGFFGCHVALRLRRLGMAKVIVAERETGIMRRASYVNQARVHNGYHYPRAPGTAYRSRVNFARFCQDHPFAIASGFEKIYAIARQSQVNAAQFTAFCAQIGAPCRESDAHLRRLFDPGLIEAAFVTREVAFDSDALAADLLPRVRAAGVEMRFETVARIGAADETGVTVHLGATAPRARYVFNCTYAALDQTGAQLRGALKKELAEIGLIEPSPVFAGLGVTVMDGPCLLHHAVPGARLPLAQPCPSHAARRLDRPGGRGDPHAQPDHGNDPRRVPLHARHGACETARFLV